MKFDPVAWDACSAGRSGGASWIFERGIELVATLAGPAAAAAGPAVDAGCGSGHLARRLHAAGWRVTGLDADPDMLRHAALGGPGIDWITGNVEGLPIRGASLGLITASSLIGCLASPDHFMAEAYRCLVPGGRLIITATNRRSLLLRLNHRLPRRWVVSDDVGGPIRFTTWSRRELGDRLARAGFRVEEIRMYNFVLHAGRWLLPPRSIARWCDALGHRGGHDLWARNVIVAARKPRRR